MKKFTNRYVALLFAAATVFSVGCDDNDEIRPTDDTSFDVAVEVAEGAAAKNGSITVDANTQKSIKGKVTFTSTSVSMKRLYITVNEGGQGEEIYEPSENIDTKGDGAVDLENGDGKTFTYIFTLPVPSGVKTGTVVYKFWTTTGNGDFRDQSQRLAVGPGTITLNYGGTNSTASLRAYSTTMLAAPLANGNSATFLSLANGSVYKINQGAEYAAFWDFGYYYSVNGNASLASTAAYEKVFTNDQGPVVPVSTIAKTTELNNAYFAKSTITTTQFTNFTKSSDLTFNKPTAENVTGLKKDDIIEFVDAYNKKGLIRVVEVKGTYNEGDYIKIDVKVQP